MQLFGCFPGAHRCFPICNICKRVIRNVERRLRQKITQAIPLLGRKVISPVVIRLPHLRTW